MHEKLICNDCGHIVHGSKNMQFHMNNHKKSTCPDCEKVLYARNMAKHKCKPKQNDTGKKRERELKGIFVRHVGRQKTQKPSWMLILRLMIRTESPTNVTVVTINLPGLLI